MIDIQTVEAENLNKGMLLLREEFAKRGWSAQLAYLGSPHCFVDRGDGKPLHIFSTTPPTTTYADAALANDKLATHALLETYGIHQLRSVVAGEVETYDRTDARNLMHEVGRVVVKPFDGGHGKGITVDVQTEQQLEAAIQYGLAFAKNAKRVVVQEQYAHSTMYDIRIACIDGVYQAAVLRVAARVFGDGIHTVRELIDQENNSPQRGKPYYAQLAVIDQQRAADYLGDAYESVPDQGKEVQVLGVANYGAGGELVDVTDDIPAWMIAEAEKVSNVTGLKVSGIDYMLSALPTKNATEDDVNPVVIEINKCPALVMHDAPTRGTPRGVVAAYVDYLARIDV